MGYISYDVKCPACGDIYYETTEFFDPARMATGEMLRFKTKFGPGGYNWSMPFTDYDMAEALVCVECGGAMAPNGFLKVEGLSERFSFEHLEEINRELKGMAGGMTVNPIESIDQALVQPDNFYQESANIDQALAGESGQQTLDFGQGPETIHEQAAEEMENDPLAKYTAQKACPECGRFFSPDEWPNHLAGHSAEARERILKPPVPEEVNPVPVAEEKKKGRRIKAKVEEAEDPAVAPFQCPMCEAGFETRQEFKDHLTTHDMGKVQQITDE